MKDGMAVAEGEKRGWVVYEGKLYKNYMGQQWLVWVKSEAVGCAPDATVEEFLAAKKGYSQGEMNLAITKGEGFYDRCTGVQCTPM